MKTALDPLEENALVKKPKPIGWFIAGLMGIGFAGFAAAFYLPLTSAHELLVAEHEKLAQKAQELDQTVRSRGSELASASGRKDALESFIATAAEKEKAYRTKSQELDKSVADGMDKLVRAKQVSVESGDDGSRISVSNALLFKPKTSKPLPAALKVACAVAYATKGRDAKIRVEIGANAGDKEAFTNAAAQAGAIADLLAACKLESSAVSVHVETSAPSDKATLVVTSGAPPSFSALAAPAP